MRRQVRAWLLGGIACSLALSAAAENPRRRPGTPQATPMPSGEPLQLKLDTQLAPVLPLRLQLHSIGAVVPDRWRVLDNLGLNQENLFNPYAQNTLKGDKPIRGHEEFLVISGISDTVFEPRHVITPVAPQATNDPNAVSIFGGDRQSVFAQTFTLGLVYLKGDTTFRPPDWELHLTPAFQFNRVEVEENRVLRIDPRASRIRRETFIGMQELFADYHLRNVSDRYDFDSVRFGIQPVSLDFRGFLLQDLPYSLRLFGNRDNNQWQYNVLWARRLEKDTNSGLNAIHRSPRNEDIFAANLYRQDFPVVGFTSQLLLAHHSSHENDEVFYNRNGFIERPASIGLEQGRGFQVTYLGANGDGHFGRTNLTASTYLAIGREDRGVFTARPRDILAGFAAAEASWDFDWTRLRLSALWASGDDDPFDGTANGFDAITENPIFAGADTSYWMRQSVPLVGGGGVGLSSRNGVLNSLRSSAMHGQSNFANPGTMLAGVGSDHDLTPTLRVSTNFNHLWFADPTVVEVARNQAGVGRAIGFDLSTALIWRPLMSQNAVVRLSYAVLLPGAAFKQLFPGGHADSLLANITFSY